MDLSCQATHFPAFSFHLALRFLLFLRFRLLMIRIVLTCYLFSGSRMVLHLVNKYPNYLIVNFDKLDYCASLYLLKTVENKPNYEFIKVLDLFSCLLV